MSPLNIAKAGRSNHHVQSLYKTARRDTNVLNPDMNQPSNTANHEEPSPREPLMRECGKCDRSAAPRTGSQKRICGKRKVPYAEAVQVDQTLPMGRIWNPGSMDHPIKTILCLVLDFLGMCLDDI